MQKASISLCHSITFSIKLYEHKDNEKIRRLTFPIIYLQVQIKYIMQKAPNTSTNQFKGISLKIKCHSIMFYYKFTFEVLTYF